MTRRNASLTSAAVATILIVGAASLVTGQAREEAQTLPAPGGAPAAAAGGDAAIAGRESNQGVYVRDSAVAVEKFALAQRMERLKEWNKAADALQEIVEKSADRVVPSQVDDKNVIYQYTSVMTAVQERLAKWPAEGLDVYRARFEPLAASALEQAGGADDVGGLHRVYALYFVTDTGKAAGMRLVDLYMESGEFPAAAWMAERLLAWHPSIDAERPRLLYRAALAYHLAGDAKNATARLETLKKDFADAKGSIRGQDVALAESLAQELATAPPVARGVAGDSWPMLGGSPDRGRIPQAGGRLGALINYIEYARTARPRNADAAAQIDLNRTDRRARDDGSLLGVMPAVDRGELFFQDNARVYGVSLESGVVLPGWAATYGDRGGQYVSPGATPLPRNQQMTVTVTENTVLAITGQLDSALQQQGIPAAPDRETRLVCLDRATGKERWSAVTRQLPEPQAALRALSLSGSPLVVGDNVYVLGRGGKPMQFEDSYVLCYALKDGAFRWACYLASGNVDPNVMQGMASVGDNVAHLAYASGRLYALTNLGALAAIDAYSGQIVWLNIYPRPKPDFADLRGRFVGGPPPTPGVKPWMHNPVIVKDGKVFILPADAQEVLVYDAGSGIEIQRIPTREFESAKTLLGIVGERMLLTSEYSIFCINWQSYNAKNADPNASLIWPSTFGKSGAPNSNGIRGRGFVTTDSVFVPTARALFRLSLKSGRVEQSYPRDRVWDDGEGPGNVLTTADHVILATADRVNVYTDLTVARAKLDAEVDAAPNNPDPRLRYAEMMFVSNQLDVAVEKLDEAISLLSRGGNATAMPSGPHRDRVFNIALTFAQKLADPEAGGAGGPVPPQVDPAEQKVAEGLFDRAGAAADSPAQHVNYRVVRARYSEPPEQVRLFQEILAEPRFRDAPFAQEDGTGTGQAGELAESEIKQLIETQGRDVYASFEAKAREALAAAKAAGNDPATLRAIAEGYPNSGAAPEAMIAAADAFESAGNHRQAVAVLGQIAAKYIALVGPARVVEARVRNQLKLPGGVGAALGRLQPTYDNVALTRPMQLPDGTIFAANVPLKNVRDALYQYSIKAASDALPEFRLPEFKRGPDKKFPEPFLPETPETTVADVDMLIVPPAAFARHERLLTWTIGKGLAIYAVGQTNPIGSHVAFTDKPAGAAWVDGGRAALVWGPTRLILLAGETGAALWEVPLKSLPGLDVIVASDVFNDVPVVATGEGENAVIEMQLRIANRVIARPRRFPLPNPAAAGAPVGDRGAAGVGEQIIQVRPAGDRAIVTTTNGRLMALELGVGKVAWQKRLLEGPIAQVVANDDFTVARFQDAAGVQLAAFVTYDGRAVGPRRVFSPADPSRQPLNMAISPDGTLVFVTQNLLCGKNLHDDRRELNYEKPPASAGQLRYANATRDGQLVISNGRILVLSDNGAYVRVHALETGEEAPSPLSTKSNEGDATIHTVASRIYVKNSRNVVSYNLDRPEEVWDASFSDSETPPVLRDIMIGRDYLLLLDQVNPTPPPNPVAAANVQPRSQGTYKLFAFSRALTPRGGAMVENGRIDYVPSIKNPAGITDEWQAVTGGVYYRAADRTLHFLRGARATQQS